MLQWLYTYIGNVCSKCFIYFFRRILQMCYLDVAYVSHICCKCLIWMLHMLLQWLFKCFQVFLQVFQKHVSSVSSVFRCVLQIFHPLVSKVNRYCCWGPTCRSKRSNGEVEGARAISVWGQEARTTFGRARAPMWACKTECRRVRPDVQALALPIDICPSRTL
jgi:hypothetical protein